MDSDKRVQWEQCGTNVVELWNDGLDHEIIEVQGGGPGRGYPVVTNKNCYIGFDSNRYGCAPFSYVAHVYHMLVPATNNAGLSLLAFEVSYWLLLEEGEQPRAVSILIWKYWPYWSNHVVHIPFANVS